MADHSTLDTYRKLGQMPIAWQLTARELICAANVLYRRYRKMDPATLHKAPERPQPLDLHRFHTSAKPILVLYGLAIENLAKAVLVAQGVDATTAGALNRKLKHHNLSQLFREARITLDAETSALLDRLQDFVEAGKYPVGARAAPELLDGMMFDEVKRIGRLLDTLEDSLRALKPGIFDTISKTVLLELCATDEM